jgi:DNA-binding SARP family transcriptional activator/predicted Ser/Thr protein kinase
MIRLESLGGLRVLKDGEELPSFQSKPLRSALLTYLAVERETSRQHVCFLLWPDSSPERARGALSQTLYELRRELGGDWLESAGDRLAATGELSTDVSSLVTAAGDERHGDTVEAYGGPFLDGVSLGGGVEFERWVEEKRSEIHRIVRVAFRSAMGTTTDPHERTRLARGWVQLDPLDDEGQHALIESLALSGDRSGALEQYRVYSQLIATELEVEPLDHTVELVERIRSGEVVAAPEGRDEASVPDVGRTDGVLPASGARDSASVRIAPSLSVSRLIGRGATGFVYLAREPALRRLVAVKVLEAELAKNPTARARFEREAQSAARIVHPNVATVHQIGTTEDGRPYLVMQYVKGGTLADRMKAQGPFPADKVRDLLADAASALAAAHRVGVIHRDVRPANFLYDEETGRTYLTDFGVAGVLESGTEEVAQLTRTGELLGNAEYISPEQARGDELDDRSDVYSLGVLGRVLLFGSPAPSQDVPPGGDDPQLLELLARATAKEPRHRPSAAAFAEALERPAGVADRNGWALLRELRRRRMLPLAGVYTVAGLVATVVIDQLVRGSILPPVARRLGWAFLIAGLAATIIVSWFHGELGHQHVSRSELALLAIVLVGWLLATVLILA